MTDGRTAADRPLTAVLDAGALLLDASSTLELRGPLDPALLEAALAQVAAEKPALRQERPHILRHGPRHHTLHLTGLYPLGTLADLLTAAPHTHDGPPEPRTWPHLPQVLEATPLQQELLADIAAHPHHQVAQLGWRWHGPLDTARFTAAWQSVFDREAVLRAAFVFDPHPRLALHPHARPRVTRHAHGSLTRRALREQERRHGFDPARPGMLRAALLEGAPPEPPGGPPAPGGPPPPPPPTYVLLTYHRGLLDRWSVRILVQEFYRAYLAAGAPRGGERRPDLRDYRRWLNQQDTRAARDLWSGQAVAGTRLPRARPGATTGHRGTGRTLARLTRTEATRLTAWAARCGATESNALQAVWAMLLHRAAGHSGPAPVTFSVTVSGRGIPMDGITRLPAALESPLPMTLHIDPAAPLTTLLHQARDRALDMTAYEWVSAGHVREWTASTAPDTALSFAHHHRPPEDLALALAAHHIHVEEPEPAGDHSAHPLSVQAHRDSTGCLVLTAVHDRRRLLDDTAAALLARSARLLRHLPLLAPDHTTIAQALTALGDAGTPDEPAPPLLYDPPDTHPRLLRLRPPLHPGAGTVCLITSPGTPHTGHADLVRHYPGPQALTALHPDAARVPQCLPLLRPHLRSGAPLVLGGFSGAGALAYELARHLAADTGQAPLVVLGTACGTPQDSGCQSAVRELAHAIAAATAAPRDP